jgi:hypothetical protein
MSRQNVEIVRKSYAGDVELVVSAPTILQGTYSGKDAVGRFFRRLVSVLRPRAEVRAASIGRRR